LRSTTHALAGPFDLGQRRHPLGRFASIRTSAQVHIELRADPSILDGIPLRIRSVAVQRQQARLHPQPDNCDRLQVTGTVTGGGANFNAPGDDTVKPVSTPFQVAGCGGLPFNPSLSGAILNGTQGIHRSDHPNLSSTSATRPATPT